jgi:hypothetical protein
MSLQQIGPPSSIVVTQARKQDYVRYYSNGKHMRTVAEFTYETKHKHESNTRYVTDNIPTYMRRNNGVISATIDADIQPKQRKKTA